MNTSYSTRMRLGAAALAASSLLILAGQLLHPEIAPARDLSLEPGGVAQGLSSTRFVLADLLFVIAFTGLLFGIATVYAHLSGSHVERQAFVGLVLTVTGIALFQTLNGVGAFAFPAAARLYLQGQQDALDVVAAILRGPLIPVAAAGIVLIALGAVVLGIAIWRSGTLPKWAGLTYAAAFVLLLLAPQPATLIRALQGVLAGAAGLALAWSIWKQAPNGPAR